MTKEEKEKFSPYFDELRKKLDNVFLCYDTLFTKWVANKEEVKDFLDLFSSYKELSEVQSQILFLLEV